MANCLFPFAPLFRAAETSDYNSLSGTLVPSKELYKRVLNIFRTPVVRRPTTAARINPINFLCKTYCSIMPRYYQARSPRQEIVCTHTLLNLAIRHPTLQSLISPHPLKCASRHFKCKVSCSGNQASKHQQTTYTATPPALLTTPSIHRRAAARAEDSQRVTPGGYPPQNSPIHHYPLTTHDSRLTISRKKTFFIVYQ